MFREKFNRVKVQSQFFFRKKNYSSVDVGPTAVTRRKSEKRNFVISEPKLLNILFYDGTFNAHSRILSYIIFET